MKQRTTDHLRLTTYKLPLTTYHLPATTYNLPLTTYQLPLTTYTYHLTFTLYLIIFPSLEKHWMHWISPKGVGGGGGRTSIQTDKPTDIATFRLNRPRGIQAAVHCAFVPKLYSTELHCHSAIQHYTVIGE